MCPKFDFLADFAAYSIPPKLPILAGLGKLTALPERELQGIHHHEGTEKIWSCIDPYLPIQVVPELGLECNIQDAKLSAFQIHAYLHPLGLIVNLRFRLSAEPGIDGFRLARLLNNIERNGLITCRAHNFKKARTVVQLMAQVRDSVAAQVFVKPPRFGIAERPFLVLTPELDPRLDIDTVRTGPGVELMSALERRTGNQQADPSTLTEQFCVEAGHTSQVNLLSGWVLVSKSGMAVYIDPGANPERANRARLCDHRNVAKLLGFYRLYHAFVKDASQAKGEVSRDAVEHAVDALDVMRIKYSRWWIRWGSERLRLEQPVKAAVERYGLARVNPPNQNISIPSSKPKVTPMLNYQAFPTALAWAQPNLMHPLVSFNLTNPTGSDVGITVECELLNYGNKRSEFAPVQQGGSATVDLQFALRNPFPISFDTRYGDFAYSAWLELQTGARTPLKNTSVRMALSPIDTFVFAHRDAVSRRLIDLSWMISAWVSKEQAVRLPAVAKARQINGGDARGYAVPDIAAGVRAQVKALYEALQTANLTYDDSATVYHLDGNDFAQRVRLPNRSLEEGAANCLDGSVLFASLLAAIGLHPIILLLPGHAIAGWKLENSETSDVEFIETTVLAKKTFDEAHTEGMTRRAEVKALADNWQYTGELTDLKAFAIPIDIKKEWSRRMVVPLPWN